MTDNPQLPEMAAVFFNKVVAIYRLLYINIDIGKVIGMEKVVVSNVESLYTECAGHKIDIYGAKTVAQRACYYLESKGLMINSFVVSNRYKNPEVLRNKAVTRIEEGNKSYDCMVLAVSGTFVWDAEEELESYDICKLVIINPLMDDDFPTSCLISDLSKISERAFLSDKIQLFSDETSCIVVDDNVVVKEGTIILASANSRIHIKKGTCIGEKAFITADDNSVIEISENSGIGEKSSLKSTEDSTILLGKKLSIGYMSSLSASKKSLVKVEDAVSITMLSSISADRESKIRFDGENNISQNSNIGARSGANISIGRETTFEPNLYMVADRSDIEIGEDNMFSLFVKMNTGSHKVIDRKSRKDITNRNKIRTGNHVWIGMGATLLPGCDVANNCIVGAAAVVTKSIEPYSACAGNPAVVIKRDIDWDRDIPPEE